MIKPYTSLELFFHVPYETETCITAQNLILRDARKMMTGEISLLRLYLDNGSLEWMDQTQDVLVAH